MLEILPIHPRRQYGTRRDFEAIYYHLFFLFFQTIICIYTFYGVTVKQNKNPAVNVHGFYLYLFFILWINRTIWKIYQGN